MSFFEALVAVVFICSISSIVARAISRPGAGRHDDAVLKELRALRAEVNEVKRQNTDVILTFDATLQNVDRRLDRLEASALPMPTPRAAESAGSNGHANGHSNGVSSQFLGLGN